MFFLYLRYSVYTHSTKCVIPTHYPSQVPSKSPVVAPSTSPSNIPTMTPTIQPTDYCSKIHVTINDVRIGTEEQKIEKQFHLIEGEYQIEQYNAGHRMRNRYVKIDDEAETTDTIRFWDDRYVELKEEQFHPKAYKRWRIDIHNRENTDAQIYYLQNWDDESGLYNNMTLEWTGTYLNFESYILIRVLFLIKDFFHFSRGQNPSEF